MWHNLSVVGKGTGRTRCQSKLGGGLSQRVFEFRSGTLLTALSRSCLLLWRAAPGEIKRLTLLTAISSAGPVVALYLGKVVIDGTAAVVREDRNAALLSQTLSDLISDPAILASVIGFVVLNILLDSAETLEAFELGSLGDRLEGHARSVLYEKVSSFEDVALFEQPEKLNVLQMANQAIPKLQGLTITLSNLLTGFFTFVPVFVLSFSIAWWVPVLISATAVPSVLAQAHYENRAWNVEFSQASRYRQMALQGKVLTGPEYAKDLRLFGLQGLFLSRWRSLFWAAYEDVRRVRRRGTLVVVGFSLVSGLGAGLPYVYVVAQAFAGAFSLGDLALYAGLVFQVRRSLFVLVANATELQDAALSSAAIFRLLDMRPTLTEVRTEASYRGNKSSGTKRARKSFPADERNASNRDADASGIRIEDVCFSYPATEGKVLSGMSLSIHPHETVVVVGGNGAGKTTLAKLLCRLYDPGSGTITWGGKDLRDFSLSELRERIAVLNQDYARFPATAGDNIAFGLLDGVNDERGVRQAAESAGIAGAIEKLSAGFDTPISKQIEGGTELSGGQWQRIALARALLRVPRTELFIFDEPTAALDAKAEYEVLATLRRMTTGKMSLIISHRLALARHADRIVVMDDGRIVESGTHGELMEAGGLYHDMFSRQAKSYIE